MGRTNIYSFDELEGRKLVGWFDPKKAESFEEATRWNGSSNISVATGSEFDHEELYRTKGGRWVLNRWSQWQGSEDVYTYLTDEQAKEWLLICERDEAIQKYFGELEEESGPGRPKIGAPFNLVLHADLKERIAAQSQPGESLAATMRRLLEKALTES